MTTNNIKTLSILEHDKNILSGLRPKRKNVSTTDLVSEKILRDEKSRFHTTQKINPLDKLHSFILSWDLVTEIRRNNSEKKVTIEGQSTDSNEMANLPDAIPTKYDSVDSYINTWEPLLVDEMKSSTLRNINENSKILDSKQGEVTLTYPDRLLSIHSNRISNRICIHIGLIIPSL
jgi:hypothetical protein